MLLEKMEETGGELISTGDELLAQRLIFRLLR